MENSIDLFGSDRLSYIFTGHHAQRLFDIFRDGRKLIHYTSAENALNVFRSRQMWMRNVRVMNDLHEVTHGVSMVMSTLNALKFATKTPIETGLAAVVREVDEIFPGLAGRGNDTFRAWRFHIENQSYVACLSEHMPDEDNIGRLSMWRNYTGQQSDAFRSRHATTSLRALGPHLWPQRPCEQRYLVFASGGRHRCRG